MAQFRQASVVAVALTGLLLLLFSPAEVGLGQDAVVAQGGVASAQAEQPPAVTPGVPDRQAERVEDVARVATEEATGALRDIWVGFLGNLPRYAIAVGILFVAWFSARLLGPFLRWALGQWERADAITALSGVAIWLLALGIALSILVGDIRALVGSLGLVGLALSWALQAPIESFTGWLLNSFQGYYRVGDRIAVGEAYGDVYKIDFLTTTVWEYGGPDRPPAMVQAEQATGRLITFPNSEVLTGTVINYTRDFPYVWDELVVAVANESDVAYAVALLQRLAGELLGGYMEEPTRSYAAILARVGLEGSVSAVPQVYVSMTDWGTNLTVRYLVGARERRHWKSEMSGRVLQQLNMPEHAGKILPVYPRQQVQLVRSDGAPFEVESWREGRG
ncbi:hypothetical protein BH24DEI1_BH24DEI1_08750 [soil metagenome]